MKKLIVCACLSVALIVSCDKKQDEHAEHTATEQNVSNNHEHAEEAQSDGHANTVAGLELNNGKKWKTNTEMLPFIQEQEKLINAFDSDTGDYKKLAEDLSYANDRLIKSCTMTGKSHDVLHVWLSSHMKNIDLLGKAANREEADQITDALEESMETYHHYFNQHGK